MHIALKECAEIKYWLRLLNESEYIIDEIFNSLINDWLATKKMHISTLNTIKKSNLQISKSKKVEKQD